MFGLYIRNGKKKKSIALFTTSCQGPYIMHYHVANTCVLKMPLAYRATNIV